MSKFYEIAAPITGKLVRVESPGSLEYFHMQNEADQDKILYAPGPGRVTGTKGGDDEDIIWMRLFDFGVEVKMVVTKNGGFGRYSRLSAENTTTYKQGESIMHYIPKIPMQSSRVISVCLTVCLIGTGPMSVALSRPADNTVDLGIYDPLIYFQHRGEGNSDPEHPELIAQGWKVSR